MSPMDSTDSLAAGLARLVAGSIEALAGPGANHAVLGRYTWAELGAAGCFVVVAGLFHALAASFFLRKRRSAPESWRTQLFNAFARPVYVLIWIFSAQLVVAPFFLRLASGAHPVRQAFETAMRVGLFAVLFWVLARLARVMEKAFAARAKRSPGKLDDIAISAVARSMRVVLPVLAVILGLPLIGLPPEYAPLTQRLSGILLVLAVAWVLSQAVHFGEQAVLAKYDISAADNLQARKVYTQVHVLGKTLYALIGIFTVASILMLFDEVRRFGTSILASAGVIGIIAGFAAQRTIANLFAGFQLAMTQPIRLDDVVIVEGEWGRVEEITLTYVVVRIWDDRRLVVPLSYFIEKPFQNWTRVSASLLGSVFIWMDYTVPLGEVRQAARQIVESSALWDRRFWNVQVTDATEHALQIRVLATAADSGKAWDLRCDIRERLIGYLQEHHPHALPAARIRLSAESRPPA